MSSSHVLSPQFSTLLHALERAAQGTRGVTLVPERDGQPDEFRSYQQLWSTAHRVASALATAGVKKGDRVLMVLPTSFSFLTSFFGIQLLGAIPVPAYPPVGLRMKMAVERLCACAAAANIRYCITNRMLKRLLGELALRVPNVQGILEVESLESAASEEKLSLSVVTEDAAFIQFTSGSTSVPKGVLLPHASLVANIHTIGMASKVATDDVVVSWLPLYHDMGLIGTLLFSIYWDLPFVLMSPVAFLTRPVRWLAAISRHKGTLSPAPNFAYGLCARKVTAQEREGLQLHSWRIAYNGAERVNPDTLRAFQNTYAPYGFRPETMLPVYGLAESSLAVTFPALGAPPSFATVNIQALASGRISFDSQTRQSIEIACVGKALPFHQLRVVDERGQDVAERVVGQILTKGPSLMREYDGNPDATAATLRDGWLWTGDLGFLEGGQLYVTGRAKDLLIVRGRNIYPEDVERAAETIEGVRPGSAIAFSCAASDADTEKFVLVLETAVTSSEAKVELQRAVNRAVLEAVELQPDEVVLVPPGTQPKTSSGKKQRSLCRVLYMEGELKGPPSKRAALALVVAQSFAGHAVAKIRQLIFR